MNFQRREMLFTTLASTVAASLPAAAAPRPGAKEADVNPLVPSTDGLRKPAGVKLGIGLTCPSPELAQICAHSGFDVVMIDMEHGPISIESACRMVSATLGTSAEAWIRVAANDVTLIKQAFDTGARNIVVPMVTTKAETEQAVAASKYPPRGVRGWGPFRAQYHWQTSMVDYAQRADRETQVTALIEHPRALENLDEILSVEGLGGAIAAPLDLAVNMGFTDGPGHPEVQEALASASDKIAAKGFGRVAFAVTPEQGSRALARGATLLFLGFDTMFVPASVENYLARLSHAGTEA
jgi:2-keto-3-deoxy-L-rhamnonate aldolase RhmA